MKKLLRSWYLWLAIGVLAIATGTVLDYRVYSNHKFNAVVLSVQNQELQGTEDYVAMVNLNAEINTAGSSQSASSSQLASLQKDANNIKQIVTNSCNSQASDITSRNLDDKVKHLWLNSRQKEYITNAKTVLNDLVPSLYSNGGMCKNGGLTLAVDENALQMFPGSVTVAQLNNNPDTPTAQQISSLQKYTTTSVIDATDLKRNEPAVAAFYTYLNSLYANLYNELKASEEGNTTEATQYAAKVAQLSSTYTATYNKFDSAAKAYNTAMSTSAITAAKAEISLIDTQVKDSALTIKLDYTVPVFWMIDAKLGAYNTASKNGTNPPAHSTVQLVSVLHDSDLTTLYNRGLLQKASYTSLGSNNSGGKLSVVLLSGKTLTEYNPPTP